MNRRFIKNWMLRFRIFRKLVERVGNWSLRIQGKGYLVSSLSEEVDAVSEFLKISEVSLCIDAGANVGRYSKALRSRFPSAKIVAVEPAPTNVEKIRKDFCGDNRLSIIEGALTEKEGRVQLFSNVPGTSKASLTQRDLDHLGMSFLHSDEVQAVRFENYWREVLDSAPIDILKLDVEGHELEALRGCGLAVESIKVVQFEFGGCNIDTRIFFRDFWKFFCPKGFDLFRITPYDLRKIAEYKEDLEHFLSANYIAVNRRYSSGRTPARLRSFDEELRYFLFSIKQPNRIIHVLDQEGLVEVDNAEDADVLFTMINTAQPHLSNDEIRFLNETGKPVVLLERVDSCVVWFRQFDQLDNLKLVLKNRNFRNLEDNNRDFFLWREHLDRIREAMKLPLDYNEPIPDASSGTGRGKLARMSEEDCRKVKTVAWDFMSSPLGRVVKAHGSKMIPFEQRDIDVFCVSSPKEGILGESRMAIKNEVERIGREHGLKVETRSLSKEEFSDRLRRAKISVSANGWGEQVHADWYAVFSAVSLFKPDCRYVKMVPDLYREGNVSFFHHDLSDLESKILGELENFEERKPRILKLREEFMNLNEDEWRRVFVQEVRDAVKTLNEAG